MDPICWWLVVNTDSRAHTYTLQPHPCFTHSPDIVPQIITMDSIHYAAIDGDAAAVRRLVLEDGTRLNKGTGVVYTPDEDYFCIGCTPLMLAAGLGHDVVVEELLGLGAETEMRDEAEMTAVHYACESDQPSTLAILVKAGADPEALRPYTAIRPLWWAAYQMAWKCMHVLLDCTDVDVNYRPHGVGNTALHRAAMCDGAVAVVQALLGKGADPHVTNNHGFTPLDEAMRMGMTENVAVLEAAMANKTVSAW